jgi:hypothetical protein
MNYYKFVQNFVISDFRSILSKANIIYDRMKYFGFEPTAVTAVTAKPTAVKGLTMYCRFFRGAYS